MAGRYSRRELVLGVGGLAGFGGAAHARPVPLKILTLATRKAEVSPKTFADLWRDAYAALARQAPGLRGLVVSEPLPRPDGARPPFDGVASIWFDTRAAADAAMDGPAGRTLRASLRSLIDPANSASLYTHEHVFVPPARTEGTIKRTSLVVRDASVTHAQFMRHWLTVHGPWARGIPGVKGFVLTELYARPPRGAPTALAHIDGISESWWEGGPADQGGMVSSPEHSRWSADGNSFIDRAGSAPLITREHILAPPPGAALT